MPSHRMITGAWPVGLLSFGCTLDVYSEPEVDASAPGQITDSDQGTQSCDTEDCGEDACSDGRKNNGETGIDCGGPCVACPPAASCSDGKKNQDETGVDCGGKCDACESSETCSDGKRNQGETGVDCGGPCEACSATPTCSDATQNQDEAGVDCGGVCDPCASRETCSDGLHNQDEGGIDCGGVCEACPALPTCDDLVQNQDEVGVDCGGVCPVCLTCDDELQNQDEVAIDCGGICGACPLEGSSKFIGNITQGGVIRDDFGIWNQFTPENDGKWRNMEPSRDEMNWERMDEYYAYTRSRGIALKAHTFCWGSQEPDWIAEVPPQEQAAEVEEYIASFCERYPGVEYIDVVNEPDHAPPTYRAALGGAGETGHDWVIQCFEWARQYCPNATLILNDYNVLRWDTDPFIAIARKVKATGLLDAVGEQGHSLETIEMSELRFNMQKLAALDLPIFISEYDVDVAGDEEQLAVYKQQFPFFYNHPQVVGITLWGYIQGQTWRENTFLQRANGSRRPAYDWLVDTYLTDGSLCGNAACESNEDCNSCSMDCGSCDDSCSDGELSNGETNVDCGGPCEACAEPESSPAGAAAPDAGF